MDLRHARTFVTVAEIGTVSKAAHQLHITQPALSRQIAAFEQALGLKLFDRIGRRLVLTSEGDQLLNDCRGLLSYADAIGERAESLKHGDTGVLKVAGSPQHIESVLSTFLTRYAQRYPMVEVQLFEAAGLDIVTMLERNEIHLGQNLRSVVDSDDRRFGIRILHHVDLLAACHPSLTLGKGRRAIEITQLASYSLLLLDSSFVVRKVFDAACRLAKLTPKIFVASHTPHTLLALAEAGHGVAIIPTQLRTRGHSLRILGVTYRGKPLREQLVIMWDRRRPLPPLRHRLLRHAGRTRAGGVPDHGTDCSGCQGRTTGRPPNTQLAELVDAHGDARVGGIRSIESDQASRRYVSETPIASIRSAERTDAKGQIRPFAFKT